MIFNLKILNLLFEWKPKASATLVDVISLNSSEGEANFTGSNVFEGLNVDLNVPIDAAFAWSDNRIVYLIQGLDSLLFY